MLFCSSIESVLSCRCPKLSLDDFDSSFSTAAIDLIVDLRKTSLSRVVYLS